MGSTASVLNANLVYDRIYGPGIDPYQIIFLKFEPSGIVVNCCHYGSSINMCCAEKEITNCQGGFDLGIQLLGNDGFAMLHLVLNFGHGNVYDVLLNLGAAATKRVLRVWKETGDYFFFVFKDGGLTAFHQRTGGEWDEYNYFKVMENSKSTESQYDRAVQAFKKNNMAQGTYLNLNYQNNTEFIDLKENRFEARPTRKRSGND